MLNWDWGLGVKVNQWSINGYSSISIGLTLYPLKPLKLLKHINL